MRSTLRRGAALAGLLVIAGGLGYASYSALAPRPHRADTWDQAIAVVRKAERTKAIVPSLRTRERAIALFDELARKGSPQARSRAALLAAVLHVRNAAAQANSNEALALAVSDLQRAVRLDPANDDAAYDLELLLSRSAGSRRTLTPGHPERKKRSTQAPGASPAGTGY